MTIKIRAITMIVSICILTPLLYSKTMAAQTENVVVSIKPIHALVQGVIGNTGTAQLILKTNESPHHFHLKPSQIKLIHNARIIFYVDNTLETFLEKVFATLPTDIKKIEITKQEQIKILPYRKEQIWTKQNTKNHEAHDHEEEHRHDEHDEHDHEAHNHEEEHHDEHDHEAHDREEKHHEAHDHHGHHHGDDDVHIWLDPENAKKITAHIARILGEVYPENKNIYQKNANRLIDKINRLNDELKISLENVKDKPFIVFHDAYQYFEKAYDLNGVGAILLNPEDVPSPSDIRDIRKILKDTQTLCVFAEPQFPGRIVNIVTENTNAKSAVLDPLGADMPSGENLYFMLIKNLANNLKQCLQG